MASLFQEVDGVLMKVGRKTWEEEQEEIARSVASYDLSSWIEGKKREAAKARRKAVKKKAAN